MTMKERISKKEKIQQSVDVIDATLRKISLKIHSNPELAFNEHNAVEWLIEPLKEAGFKIEKGVANLDTAFTGTWEGTPGGPTIGILAEYDALPVLGHACGHNIIGPAAIGAALSLKMAYPNLPGKIIVIGTPAEEDGGGKILMCDEGVFDDLDVAMMVHPRKETMVLRGGLACVSAVFKFYGKESHASSAPELGISALDAVLNSFSAINSLRQFFTDDVRVHGIILKGGDAPNVVPAYCEAEFIIRASTKERLIDVKEKVYRAVEGASLAVGVRCEIEEGLVYAERNNNKVLANAFKNNLELMNIEVVEPLKHGGIGSSDIGNVGEVTATIHPYIKIGEVIPHTPEFAEATKSEAGMVGLNQAAKGLAMTAYDLCVDPLLLRSIRKEFEDWRLANKKNYID